MRNLVNATPHLIRIIRPDGNEIQVEPCGIVVRCAVDEKEVGYMDGVPCLTAEFGDIEGFAEVYASIKDKDKPNSVIIVSVIVLEAAKKKNKFLNYLAAPDTGPTAVRDEKGQIIGVRRLKIADGFCFLDEGD